MAKEKSYIKFKFNLQYLEKCPLATWCKNILEQNKRKSRGSKFQNLLYDFFLYSDFVITVFHLYLASEY